MALSRETIAAVKQAADIAQIVGEKVHLTSSGSSFKGLCPFHPEKTPSFTVNPTRGMYHCFGCGAGGSTIDFVMAFENIPFPEAVALLARRFGIPLDEETQSGPRHRGQEALTEASSYYHELLMNQPQGEAARNYLRERGFDEDAWEAFGMGFALDDWQGFTNHGRSQGFDEDDLIASGLVKQGNSGRAYDLLRDRIVFPIHGPNQGCIAFGARSVDPLGQPKYLNTPETKYYQKSRVLFGLEESRQTMRTSRRALLVEGYLDVIRLHMHGFSDAVATCGTSLTGDHVDLLERYVGQVVLVFDGDQAGLKAALRSAPLFLNRNLEARVVLLPDGLDPDDFVREKGNEAMEAALKDAKPLLEFLVFNTLQAEGHTLEGKERTLRSLLPLLSEIRQPTARDVTIRYLADLIEVRPEAISEMLRPANNRSTSSQPSNAAGTSQQNTHDPSGNNNGNGMPSGAEGNTFNFSEREGRHQMLVLQILLKERHLLTTARELLNPEDISYPPLQALYKKMLALTDAEYKHLAPTEMADLYPDVAPAIRHLLLKESHGMKALGDAVTVLQYEITLVKEAHKEQLKHQLRRAKGSEEEEFIARRFVQLSNEIRTLKSLPGTRNRDWDAESARSWQNHVLPGQIRRKELPTLPPTS